MASSTDNILKLTAAESNQSSFVLFSDSVNSAQGLSVTFDFYSYGGTGGDGISFFVLDAAVGTVTTVGGFGGSLGYANRLDSDGTVTPGIAGGYVGIGFDEFGNYSQGSEGRNGGDSLPLGGRDSIAIRGAAAQGYQYLTGVGGLSDNGVPLSIDNPIPNDLNRDNAKRSAKVDLTSSGLLSVLIDFNSDGDFDDLGENNSQLQNVDIKTANGGVLPTSLSFGFGGATGNATNIHEVGNVKATDSSGVPLSIGLGTQIVGGGTGNSIDPLTGGAGTDNLSGGGGGDPLTGGGGADRFIYSARTRAAALKQSLLNVKLRDRILDFNVPEGDRILLDFDSQLLAPDLPKRLFNSGKEKGSLKKAVKAAYADKNFKQRGNQKLKPGEAVLFTQGSSTYISVNDNKAPFSPGNDFFVEVTGIQLKPGDSRLGALGVRNYFI